MRRQPPNPVEFDKLVWEIVRQVPAGQVTTYGQIASMIPPAPETDKNEHKRLSAYWVGQAMNRAREADQVPWQRVINGQGQIAMPQDSTGAQEQRRRLLNEEIVFDAKDRVDFQQFAWEGPSSDWLQAASLQAPKQLKQPSQSATLQQMRLF